MFQSKKKGGDEVPLPPGGLPAAPAAAVLLEPSLHDPAKQSAWAKTHIKRADRYVANITTDKMTYKPGQEVYVRVIILDAFTNRPYSAPKDVPPPVPRSPWDPPAPPLHGLGRIKILNGTEEEMLSTALQDSNMKDASTFSLKWKVPSEAKGGTYTVQFMSTGGFGLVGSVKRKFDVLKYEPPKFKKELTFVRKAYSEGQLVKALLNVKRAEGSFCDSKRTGLTVTARIDGEEVFRDDNSGKFRLGDNGKCIVSFRLPEVIKEGKGTLSVAVTEGITETVSKTLPIVLKKLDCILYPEGGELILGVCNGVYAQARTPTTDPADFLAVLVERVPESRSERIVVEGIETKHEGRAYFEFTPSNPAAEYVLRVIKPPGITHFVEFANPMKKSGVSLRSVKKESLTHGEPLEVVVESSERQKVHVGVFKRDLQLVRVTASLGGAGKPEKLSFVLPEESTGVLRVTVYAEDLTPLAERVVFVEPKETLSFEVKTEKEIYAPGENVKVTVKAKRGESYVDARLGITVTNDSVRKMTEKRRRVPRLPAMQMLESEVEELCDCMAYFAVDEDDPKKVDPKVKVDLLLGTQGWRRFVYKDPETAANHPQTGQKVKRLLAVQYEEPPKPVVRLPPPRRPQRAMMFARGAAPRKRMQKMAIPKPASKRAPAKKVPAAKPAPKPAAPPAAKPPAPVAAPVVAAPPPPPPPAPVAAAPPPPPPPARVAAAAPRAPPKPMMKQAMPMMRRRMARGRPAPRRPPRPSIPVVPKLDYFREYAHAVKPGRVDGQRVDFTETLYYVASSAATKKQGVTFSFALNDDVTSFAVLVDGFTADGCIGGSESSIVKSVKPFFVTPKMPMELSFGDIVKLPVAMVNNLTKPQTVKLTLAGTDAFDVETSEVSVELGKLERKPHYYSLKVKNPEDVEAAQSLKLSATTSLNLSDSVEKPVDVTPFGFPVAFDFGGRIAPGETKTFKFNMPKVVIPGSLGSLAYAYPSPLSNLTKGLESLIQRPGGCFEQTSMTMYPMIMAIQYFESHEGADEALIAKANEHLDYGYKRLLGFECKKHGFDWFGSDPGHEALSSMGIMEFTDLSTVFPVDEAMIARTRKWLMSRKKKDGTGFDLNPRCLHTWSPDPAVSNAYVLWALSRSGAKYSELETMATTLEAAAKKSTDSYFIALVALALFEFKQADRSLELVKLLVPSQADSGAVEGGGKTITCSSGDNALVEATSLAILSFCNFPGEFQRMAENGVEFLSSKCSGGRYGSTQATILALQAIIKYDVISACADAEGALELKVNDADELSVGILEGNRDAVVIPPFGHLLKPGEENTVSLTMHEAGRMPFSIQAQCYTPTPHTAGTKSLTFSKTLTTPVMTEGDTGEVNIELANTTKEGLAMTVAIVSLPSGLTPRMDKLKELKRSGTVASFELFGARDVVFYFRCIEPETVKKFSFDVIADIPGTYQAKSSSAYLYYGDDCDILYDEGLKVEIRSKS